MSCSSFEYHALNLLSDSCQRTTEILNKLSLLVGKCVGRPSYKVHFWCRYELG